ncbi:oligosaccharide flippase family protein [Patescibacteria group bacterium]|nr:oligosaccharide flippase family protein [Patescibacteria group bacterium]MBU1472768.1 oligosaccharide flippase family protein [Patescibacteria group bacterium]MBU2460034.1 oligosaccharide flippase family protein [Patescibacteria group bacterium]MBU2544308.1 oligosaccharide flippase family protein [Patescibacteria group bacterium]
MGILKKMTARLFQHTVARDGVIVFVGVMIANVASYLFHLLMGRILGPGGYGELSSLLSIVYIFSVPLTVGQIVLVKAVSELKAREETGQVKTLFWKLTKACTITCLIALPFVIMASPIVVAFLHIQSPSLFVLAYILFVFSLLTMLIASLLQGYQKFVWFSMLGAGIIVLKLIFSIPAASSGVFGVMLATTVSAAIMYVVYFYPIRFVLKATFTPMTITRREAYAYAVPTLLAILGSTSLFSTDIILVRHFFEPIQAGLYAALAVLGKVIFYASSAVGLVFFPVLAERCAKRQKTRKLSAFGVIIVCMISFGIIVIYFMVPKIVVSLLFGRAYIDAAELLGPFGIFLSLFSVGNLLMTINLALGNTGVWVATLGCAVLQILGISLFHESIAAVLWVDIIVGLLFVTGAGGYYLWCFKKEGHT